MSDLAYVLRQLPPVHDPNLLLGDNPADDAAVYRVRDDLALVQTLDFFTPIVDDPYTFGRIAAANSLSDVYAVGGTPLNALNVAAFPAGKLSLDVLTAVLRGGADMAREAGIPIVGGHTVDDGEPKYGLVVTGTVEPDRLVTPRGARPGDRLFLTKPIGTGVIATAHKAGTVDGTDLDTAVRWMTTLNAAAARAMIDAGASAATDVTGFGLLGHLADLCTASGVSATLSFSSIPLLPSALRYAREGAVPGGTRTNWEHLARSVELDEGLDDAARSLLADPQTSGGLIVALPERTADMFRGRRRAGLLVAEIGRITDGAPGQIRVEA
jgi:selenide, water dikinase